MWNVIKGNENLVVEMNNFWNKAVAYEDFFKPICLEDYKKMLAKLPNFSFDGVGLVYDGDKVVGMVIGVIRNDKKGAINAILVDHEYQHQGIGSALLAFVEDYFKNAGCEEILAYGFLPSCYSWYIPNTDHHDHPCAPGIRVNSNEYFFLLHNRYEATGFQDAFHLALADYEISESISEILEENKKNGVTIEIYNPEIHSGVEEFCRELNIYDFEKVIKENLALEKPYPFLVVVKDGKVKGWTGAMWNEESGRGHFDGIAILESVRGKGLGKALFSLLAYHSKLNGAKFMTFYTGLTNHARYIYMGAGFKIIQSFAVMKKKIKK